MASAVQQQPLSSRRQYLHVLTTWLRGCSRTGSSWTLQRLKLFGTHRIDGSNNCHRSFWDLVLTMSHQLHRFATKEFTLTVIYRCGPMSPVLCLAASLCYASCAAFVGLCLQQCYSCWSCRWCCHVWTMAMPRLPVYQETSSTDSDECCSTACLMCTKVRAHNAATPRPSLVAGAWANWI